MDFLVFHPLNYSLTLSFLVNYVHHKIICRDFSKDNQSLHIKMLLVSKCSHLFWEELLLDKTFFFSDDDKIWFPIKWKIYSINPRASKAIQFIICPSVPIVMKI